MSDWLELELAHRLRPVAAPEELWERVGHGQRNGAPQSALRPRRSLRPMRLSAALASLALAAAALWLVTVPEPTLDIRQLAASGLTARTGEAGPTLRSGDPIEIRRWLRRETGLDVPLRAASGIRLEGARVVGSRVRRVGAVEYRVGGDSATLLVAHTDPACPLPQHGSRSAAWQSHDQVYALACSNPERSEAACLLCHSSL